MTSLMKTSGGLRPHTPRVNTPSYRGPAAGKRKLNARKLNARKLNAQTYVVPVIYARMGGVENLLSKLDRARFFDYFFLKLRSQILRSINNYYFEYY